MNLKWGLYYKYPNEWGLLTSEEGKPTCENQEEEKHRDRMQMVMPGRTEKWGRRRMGGKGDPDIVNSELKWPGMAPSCSSPSGKIMHAEEISKTTYHL